MSYMPRRIKDLPKITADSEDEYPTPIKTQSKQTNVKNPTEKPIIHFCNKENEEINSTTNKTDNNQSYNKIRHLNSLKRISELPTIDNEDSDDDDDDNDDDDILRGDNLNCAILNESFIISSGASDTSPSPVTKAGVIKANMNTNCNISLLNKFQNMQIASTMKTDTHHPSIAPASNVNKQQQQQRTNQIEQINVIQEPKSTIKTELLSRNKIEKTPFKADTSTKKLSKNISIDDEFATPQVRSFAMQRRPRDLCLTQSKKTHSAIVNEFRSQKVLFQTPISVSRPKITCLPSDSISLTLYDTINEIETTPNTSEKPSTSTAATAAEKSVDVKSKKSLETAFNEKKLEEDIPSQTVANASETTTNNKESILNINQKEFTIINRLGSGGSSIVYSARRKADGKECALKVVNLQGDPLVVEGYLNETKLLAKLQGNVCVVGLYDYQLELTASKLFVVMEKGDTDLNKILHTYTTSLPVYVLTNILYQMLQAVDYIHQKGVIHSDLKPANFLMVNGRLKLIDFGIASHINTEATSVIKFSQAGTFNYISPEALTDISSGNSPMRSNQPKIKISTKSDVWSLGCILYLLLYKRTPFGHIKNVFEKMSTIYNPNHSVEYTQLPSYYPQMLVDIAKICLTYDPKKRPSCSQLLGYPFHMIISLQNLKIS